MINTGFGINNCYDYGDDFLIPKKIHYCWFGGNPLTEEAKKYIDTWKKYCSDYEIIEWNEKNFNIAENDYCREAYESKKWAFVTDYVRLKVLYEYGGIYMDTDVEVCKKLDKLLQYEAVSGYESKTCIPTGTMASCRGNEWIGMLLDNYKDRHFVREDGSYDLTTNVKVITKLTKEKYSIKFDGEKKIIGDNIAILPFEYLCAKSFQSGEVKKTENTLTIHHFAGSWVSDDVKKRHEIFQVYLQKLYWLPSDKIKIKMASLLSLFKHKGVLGAVTRIINKLAK